MSLASGNPLLLICMSGAVGFGLFFASIGLYFWGTRYMFAWALDRIAPPQLGILVGRQNAPVVALVVMTVLGIMFGIMLEQVPNFSYVTGSLLQGFLFLFTCIAAIIFPWRLKSLYSGSIKSEIAGIPWITIFGVWGTAFMIVMVYYFITQSQFGTVTGSALLFSEVSIGVGVVYYIGAWLFARTRGIDLGMTYREIPPE
jgi:amino acid transporter